MTVRLRCGTAGARTLTPSLAFLRLLERPTFWSIPYRREFAQRDGPLQCIAVGLHLSSDDAGYGRGGYTPFSLRGLGHSHSSDSVPRGRKGRFLATFQRSVAYHAMPDPCRKNCTERKRETTKEYPDPSRE